MSGMFDISEISIGSPAVLLGYLDFPINRSISDHMITTHIALLF